MSFVSLKSIAISVSLAVSTAIGISAAPAFANTNFATKAKYTEGSNITRDRDNRTNADNALGSYLDTYDQQKHKSEENFLLNKNKDFLSLGLGGEAIFEFGQYFFPEITLWETTWGEKDGLKQHDERLEVFVGNE